MGGMPNMGQEGERHVLVLDRQPPLLKTSLVRIIGQDEDFNQERALVPIMPYGKKALVVKAKRDWIG